MIIRCRQCRTKFRFDDSHMQGSGIWLRCSRCGHVYFQENPKVKKTEPDSLLEQAPEIESKQVTSEEKFMPPEEGAKLTEETPNVFHREEHGQKSPDEIMMTRKHPFEGIDLDIGTRQETMFSEEARQAEETERVEETKKKKKSVPKHLGRAWEIAVWSVFVILIIPLFIYIFIFPQYGEQLVKNGEYLVKKFNEYRGVSEPVTSGAFINQMVKIHDVRYRRINNNVLGPIGVLEGNAVNRADYPLSRIKVKGEIVDAYSVVLGERVSYAGNILTDEELINLSDEEILIKLLRPEGINNSNDKIMPNGQISFMIVFPNEPAGIIKTTVMTIGAERLL